jgi:4-hydroxybutyryl-CoA dehydratase/vinylacetyl-CoA-Delta-isomerase
MLTGQEYLESLRDGRQMYIHGELVDDVATDPRLRDAAAAAARSYDRYYRPGDDAVGPYFSIPSSIEQLREIEEEQLNWDMTTVATSHTLLMLLTAASRMRNDVPHHAETIEAYIEDLRRRDIRCQQTITDAKGDRSLPPSKQDDPDLYLRIVERRSDGVVIRGAKLHISSAALVHDLIVMPTKRMKPGEEDWAFAGAVPVNAPGVTIVNATFSARGDVDPEHYPYSSSHAMSEGFVVFDDVFVPNERIFLAGEVEHSATFAHSLGLWERLGSVSHYVDVADTLVGLAQLITEANGLERVGHVKDKIAAMTTYATLIRGSYEAALSTATFTPEGWISPDELFTNAAKYYAAENFAVMVRNLHDIAGGSVLTAPSLADLRHPVTGPFVEKYMRTKEGIDAEHRMRLFHTIRDYTADAFGGWQHVTTLQGGGGLYAQRVMVAKHYDMERARTMARSIAGLPASPG